MNQFWRIACGLHLCLLSVNLFAQVSSYPYSQDFESDFVEGESVEFLPDWTGNTVATSNRIFQSSDALSGSSALAIQTISSFDGLIDVSLDLTDQQDALISFWAKSNSNGSGDRSALLYFSVSVDGGTTFGQPTQIGTDSTFPNALGETYSPYQYSIGAIADNEGQVVVRITVERNEGAGFSGSAAELLIDDFSINASPFVDVTPPEILAVEVISDNTIHLVFNEPVLPAIVSDFQINAGIAVLEVNELPEPDRLELIIEPLQNGSTYTLSISNVSDLAGNVIQPNSSLDFTYLVFEEIEPGDISINEFLPDPTPVLGLPNAEYVEVWNTSDKFLDASQLQLNGHTLSQSSLAPGNFLIIVDDNDSSLYSSFDHVATVAALTLSNAGDVITLQTILGQTISEVAYDGSVGGIAWELINPFDPCVTDESFQLSLDPAGGTPGFENSVFDPTPDSESPIVVYSEFGEVLTVSFSEPIDPASATMENITGVLEIDEIITGSGFQRQIQFSFNEDLLPGQVYELSISGILDCSGNTMEPTSISFGIGQSPQFNELLITEIYFDETPSVGLPDWEYVELYNATDFLVSLASVSLSDATNSVLLSARVLFPGEYLILASVGAAEDFGAEVLELDGFPSLNNSGELLTLSYQGSPIFSIKYSPDWHEQLKQEGGFSLEMVDVLNPCAETAANWKSSQSALGGTPGKENSVAAPGSVPDSFGPVLEQVYAISKDSIVLKFSEKLDPSSIPGSSFLLEPSHAGANALSYGSVGSDLLLLLTDSLQPSITYSLAVEGVKDCAGNTMEGQEFSFGLPLQAQPGEILLSEILFNPRAGGVDFVEFYNHSNQFLSLSGWKLARLNQAGLDEVVNLDDPAFIISPLDYIVFTEDISRLERDYPQGDATKFFELSDLPSFANDTGNVLLVNRSGDIQEHFFYDEDYHYSLLEDVDGVSLERVSFDAETQSAANWRSAASTVGFATPGKVNSQRMADQNSGRGAISVSPRVFIPGNAGSGRDFTRIEFEFSSPGKFANVSIYDQMGRRIKTLSNGASLPSSGFFRWDGDTDDGSMARMGYYLVLFEIYDGNGHSEVLKETIVVGRNF